MTLLPTAFCPSVAYLSLIASDEAVAVSVGEKYRKQTPRNRALFLTAAGGASFSIPVLHYDHPAPPTALIRLSEHGDWRQKLLHLLRSAYGTAPFWDHYESPIRDLIFDDSVPELARYNHLWLSLLCRAWDLPLPSLDPDPPAAGLVSFESLAARPVRRHHQVFDHKFGFTAGLSALDLLLNEGPYGVTFLTP